MFKLSGFGTLAATHFNRNDIDFAGGPSVQNGAGRTQSTSLGTDSKAGVQLLVAPMNNLEITTQALFKQNARNNFEPSIDWANVKYAFNDTAAVRVGRIAHPFFMMSDSRHVNYVNVSLRPSVEVYNHIRMNSSDVVEGLFKFRPGSGQLNLQTGVGSIRSDVIPSLQSERDHDIIKVRNLAYFNSTYEIGAWNFRAGYTQGDLSYDALRVKTGVFDVLSRLGTTGANIRKQWEIKDTKSSFSGIGATYDDGKIVFTSEFVMLRSGNAYNDADAWSVLGGYRIARFTPFVSYGSTRTINRIQVTGVSASLTPIVGSATATTLQSGLQSFADASLTDQNTISLGLRWDAYKNMAIKAQYDRITVKDPSTRGFLINPGSSYPARAGGNVFALSLDFVF